MYVKHIVIQLIVIFLFVQTGSSQQRIAVDVCVYGGTSAGIIAAYTASKLGKTAILIEPSSHLGGLTTGGLCYLDANQSESLRGIARDFYRRIGKHYKKFEQWSYEPHIAEEVINEYISEGKFTVLRSYGVRSVEKLDNLIQSVVVGNLLDSASSAGVVIEAKMFLDCSYEGDLIAESDISFSIIPESSDANDENIDGSEENVASSAFVPSGSSKSRLAAYSGSNADRPLETGSMDELARRYSYRLCLSSVPENRLRITRPHDYDSSRYQPFLQMLKSGGEKKSLQDFFEWRKLPNGKAEVSLHSVLNGKSLELSRAYLGTDYQNRAELARGFEQYWKGLFYFLSYDLRVPEPLRNQMLMWGYAADEFSPNKSWPIQLEITEPRRMLGEDVITQHHVYGKKNVHNPVVPVTGKITTKGHQAFSSDDQITKEGQNVSADYLTFYIPYGALVPKMEDASNLFSPVCLSASHIAFSAIRSEGIFMTLAQVAATAACISIDEGIAVQDVEVERLKKQLEQNPLADGTLPDVVIDNADRHSVHHSRGKWKLVSGQGYRSSFLQLEEDNRKKPKHIRFSASRMNPAEYDLYFFIPASKSLPRLMTATISDGLRITQRIISPASVLIKQEEGGWYYLGRYRIAENADPFVELTSDGPEGRIFADAVIWTPVKETPLNAEHQ